MQLSGQTFPSPLFRSGASDSLQRDSLGHAWGSGESWGQRREAAGRNEGAKGAGGTAAAKVSSKVSAGPMVTAVVGTELLPRAPAEGQFCGLLVSCFN